MEVNRRSSNSANELNGISAVWGTLRLELRFDFSKVRFALCDLSVGVSARYVPIFYFFLAQNFSKQNYSLSVSSCPAVLWVAHSPPVFWFFVSEVHLVVVWRQLLEDFARVLLAGFVPISWACVRLLTNWVC